MEKQRRKKEQACTIPAPRTRRLIKGHLRVTDAWGQAILSHPATVARNVHGEKGGARIEAPLSIHSVYCGPLRPAHFPENLNLVRFGNHRIINRAEDFISYKHSKIIS